jgi:hypothetical protein
MPRNPLAKSEKTSTCWRTVRLRWTELRATLDELESEGFEIRDITTTIERAPSRFQGHGMEETPIYYVTARLAAPVAAKEPGR